MSKMSVSKPLRVLDLWSVYRLDIRGHFCDFFGHFKIKVLVFKKIEWNATLVSKKNIKISIPWALDQAFLHFSGARHALAILKTGF